MQTETDILIFAGQSNMQGQTESLPEPNFPVEGAVEYHYLTDSLVPLIHPVGESIGDSLLLGSDSGHGSLVPDCCRAYIHATGRQAVAIHTARGATKISEWLKGTPRYECALKKIRSGIEKVKEKSVVGRIFYIWLQGESDAVGRTSEEDYMQMLTSYKNDLKEAIGFDKFGIIEVGYFCRTVKWLTNRTNEERRACDETIMRAQERLVQKDEDFVMLSQICKALSLESEYINPLADGHYNNKAMARIGTEVGKALAGL